MKKILKRLWYAMYNTLTLPVTLLLTILWFVMGLIVKLTDGVTFKEWYIITKAHRAVDIYKNDFRFIVFGKEV